MCGGDSADVASYIVRSDAGNNGFIAVVDEVRGEDRNTVSANGRACGKCDGAFVGFGDTVNHQREGDDVARFEFTRDGARDGGVRVGSVCAVDEVVVCDRGNVDSGCARVGVRGGDIDDIRTCGADGACVARCVTGHDTAVDGFVTVGQEVVGQDADAVGAIGSHGGGVVGVVDAQGDGVARSEFAHHFACDDGVGVL